MARMMTESESWWSSIRSTTIFTPEVPEADVPEPVDPASIELSEWGERRTELGLGGYDTGDFIGVDRDQASGMPDWRHPVGQPEPEPTAMDEYAATRTTYTSSSVFGCPAPEPRSNQSPYQAV